jgi:hypothetical protein
VSWISSCMGELESTWRYLVTTGVLFWYHSSCFTAVPAVDVHEAQMTSRAVEQDTMA